MLIKILLLSVSSSQQLFLLQRKKCKQGLTHSLHPPPPSTPPPQKGVYKHHQNFSLAQLRSQISYKKEILHRFLFLWDALSEKLEPRWGPFKQFDIETIVQEIIMFQKIFKYYFDKKD